MGRDAVDAVRTRGSGCLFCIRALCEAGLSLWIHYMSGVSLGVVRIERVNWWPFLEYIYFPKLIAQKWWNKHYANALRLIYVYFVQKNMQSSLGRCASFVLHQQICRNIHFSIKMQEDAILLYLIMLRKVYMLSLNVKAFTLFVCLMLWIV